MVAAREPKRLVKATEKERWKEKKNVKVRRRWMEVEQFRHCPRWTNTERMVKKKAAFSHLT